MSNLIAWSWSRLDTFEACPLQFYHKNVIKSVPFEQNKYQIRGERIHTHIENAIKGGAVHEEIQHMAPLIDKLRGTQWDDLVIEVENALNVDMKPVSWFAKDVWVRIKQDFMARKGTKALCIDWKGLALDTPIPVPSGWSTMGDIKEGDLVFGSDGLPYSVVGKSHVHYRDMYRITFDDTTQIECDDQHLWAVVTVQDKNNHQVIPTTELVERKHQVRVADPLDLIGQHLTLDPYLLGVWLGDGKRSSGEVTKTPELFDLLAEMGYESGKPYIKDGSACETRTILGLRTKLRELGLLGNKTIPDHYLRANFDSRLALLRGLMDTDGTWNKTRNQAVFSTVDTKLCDQVYELVVSLGMRALRSTASRSGFGKQAIEYIVSFTPHTYNPFKLPSKAKRVVLSSKWNCRRRLITEIEYLGKGYSQCISVASPDNTYLCGESFVPTHNTGKNRGYSDQLKLYAADALHRWPDVEEVITSYIFVDSQEKEEKVFHRKDYGHIWNEFGDRAERIQIANEAGDWPAKPSSMACRFCPVKECTKRR